MSIPKKKRADTRPDPEAELRREFEAWMTEQGVQDFRRSNRGGYIAGYVDWAWKGFKLKARQVAEKGALLQEAVGHMLFALEKLTYRDGGMGIFMCDDRHWKHHVADTIEKAHGCKVDREMMMLLHLPRKQREKAINALEKKRIEIKKLETPREKNPSVDRTSTRHAYI